MTVRGIRGATTVNANTKENIIEEVVLLNQKVSNNTLVFNIDVII